MCKQGSEDAIDTCCQSDHFEAVLYEECECEPICYGKKATTDYRHLTSAYSVNPYGGMRRQCKMIP